MGSIIIVIIFIVISAVSASARKTAAERAKRENAAPAQRPNVPSGDGKWFDDEYYGEGMPPVKNTVQGKPKPHSPKAHVSVPEPTQRTREAPQATVKTSLKTITASDEEETPATIQIAGTDMSFSGENALRAVIYAEVLSKPKALR